MKRATTLLTCLLFIITTPLLYSQCLQPNGIGNFEGNMPLDEWFTAHENNGSFQINTSDVQEGTQALQVDVIADSNWKVRMFNHATCYFDLVNGETYTVSFYLKAAIGAEISVTLMDDTTNDVVEDITVSSTAWTAYNLQLTGNTTSTSGRLKFNFKTAGTYLLDDLHLTRHINNWYVSPSGTNNVTGNNGLSEANPLQTIQYAINNTWQSGDTIFVMDGTYNNANYNTGNLNNGAVVSLNKNTVTGEETGWLVIKNAPGHQPKLQFDGGGGFIGTANYIEIAGFEIEGQNQQITEADALDNRLIQDRYFGGRGIAIWSGHHIYIHDNKIHDCPNSGIRVNNGDYCTIDRNEVYNNTWWSSNAESAIVFATALDIDTESVIKMRITSNLVYDNYNNIPYYNPTYPTDGPSDYGTPAQDYIIDGSGCYITRNRDTYLHGWFYFANNISYGNGINGLVVHKSDRAIVTNNTCYLNGAVPLSSGRQSSSGITVHGSDYVRMHNNISWARLDTDYGYKLYDLANIEFFEASNNILAKGLSDLDNTQHTFTDPLFVDAPNADFRLQANSPAIDMGHTHSDLPPLDYDRNNRMINSTPDIGAFEWYKLITIQAKIYLQGAYNGTELSTALHSSLPLSDPYQLGASVSSIPADVVDWVILELRDPDDSSQILAQRAAFLRKDGQILDLDGTIGIRIIGFNLTNAYIAVRHRNHLGVMTEQAILLD